MVTFVIARLKRMPILLIMVSVGLLLGGVAIANHDSNSIHACYNNVNGNLRVVEQAGECRNNETHIIWNQMGPQGDVGPQGPEGDTGPQGPPGELTAIEFDGPIQCRPVLPHQVPGGGSAVSMLRLQLDGADLGAFNQAYGLGSCSEVVAVRVGTDVELVRLLPGATIVQDPVLTRGLTNDAGVYDWRRDVMVGNIAAARGAVTTIIYDTSSEPAWETRLLDTWPSKHAASSEGTAETNSEIVTLAVESVSHQPGSGTLPSASGLGILERSGELDPFISMDSVGSSTEVIEHLSGGGGPTIKTPGALSFEFLVLRRGLSDSMSWADWRAQVDAGNIDSARQHVSLVLLNESSEEIARYNILNAWPAGYSVGFDGSMAVEQMVLVHEGFELDE